MSRAQQQITLISHSMTTPSEQFATMTNSCEFCFPVFADEVRSESEALRLDNVHHGNHPLDADCE